MGSGGLAVWGWLHWPTGPMGFCLHVGGRGHVWLPLVHVHVRAANSICSKRLAVSPLVLWRLTPLVSW